MLTGVCLFFSLVVDLSRTIQALRIALRRFTKLLGEFALLLVLVSLALTFVSPQRITEYMQGPGKLIGALIAAVVGSLTYVPGFIAYPLAGVLHQQGVPYFVLAAFVTTLMMVGVVTFPIEQRVLGAKVALVRNLLYFFLALLTSLAIGIIFKEIP